MRRRWGRLVVAAILFAVAAIVLFRQPIAEGIGKSICSQQKLNCILRISRLDFGGLTLRDVNVRNPDSPNSALTFSRLAVDFDWTSPFSLRPRWVGGEAVVVRLDLSGGPILGDLDAAVKRFSGNGGGDDPLPRLDFRNVRIIGDTPLGPVEARGNIFADSVEDFRIDMTAPAARVSFPGGEMDLREAELHATAADGNIAGHVRFDLKSFKARDAVMSDVKVDLSLDQAAGVLTGKGAASVREISLPDTRVDGAQAQADVESGAIKLDEFTVGGWLPGVRRLDLLATSGAGTVAGVSWKKGEARAKLAPRQGGKGSAGEASFIADGIALNEGGAGRLEVKLDLAAPGGGEGGAMQARGVARLVNASLGREARETVAGMVSKPLEAALPNFAAAAGNAMRNASAGFDLMLPLAGAINDDGYTLQALTGTEIAARSGLELTIDGEGQENVVTWTSDNKAIDWTSQGSLRLAGGGAPPVVLRIANAAGDGKKVAISGSAELRGWRVGDDVLAAQATGLKFQTGETGGSASGEMSAQLSGGLAGGVWSRARASGGVSAAWTPEGFSAEAPRGLTIAWDQAKYGGMTIGASALTYRPSGKLVESIGPNAILGTGAIAGFEVPVTGDNFAADAKVGPMALTWATEGELKISFDAEPAEVAMKLDDRTIPVRLEDLIGLVELSDGWRVSGAFNGGTVKAAEAEIAELKGGFDLSGAHGELNGKLNDVTLRIFDPLPAEKRRYEAATFEGSASLADSVAGFSGLFALADSGVQVASVSGQHDLRSGAGSLAFAPTPLIFRPRVFEPKALSPFLRGPANVTGRVNISGGASWSPEGLKSNASLELVKVGFTLASAGVFEGVSGKVVVDDLLALRSAPGQTLTLDKVTLGMPIEKGVVKFQLIGFDAIRLESAEWPFVDGFIRIRPTDFVFAAPENRITAQAVDWNLTRLVELFKIPDVKIEGKAGGDVPVVFSTGSARLDKAVLQASQEGGVIQYTGSTADAAAQSDQNAKLLFDALKDFRYRVLKVQLDGDLAGRIVVSMTLNGRNPAVLDGAAFDLNISIDSELMQLLNTASNRPEVSAIVSAITEQNRD